MTRFAQASLVLALLGGGLAAGQSEAAPDPVGVWKRVAADGGDAFYFQIEAAEEGYAGALLNPPEGLACELSLSLEEGRLSGEATWVEGEHRAGTRWEFTLDGDTLSGRSEWLDWEEGVVYERGWGEHTLMREPVVGLVGGSDGEEPYGDAVSDWQSLEGGWAGPGGPWALKVDGDQVRLRPVGHQDEVSLVLRDERGTLRGSATLAGGQSCDVELAYDGDAKALVGRSSWVAVPELGEQAPRGWGALRLTRLERFEAGVDDDAQRPAPGEGSIAGVWKRDDGRYLRLRAEASAVVGVLSDAEGETFCRLRFENQGGVWVGLANWGGFETSWELSVSGDGLVGRAQWADLSEGRVIARGWTTRSFQPLRRVH